jgi:hypothetical protein
MDGFLLGLLRTTRGPGSRTRGAFCYLPSKPAVAVIPVARYEVQEQERDDGHCADAQWHDDPLESVRQPVSPQYGRTNLRLPDAQYNGGNGRYLEPRPSPGRVPRIAPLTPRPTAGRPLSLPSSPPAVAPFCCSTGLVSVSAMTCWTLALSASLSRRWRCQAAAGPSP